MYQLIFYSLKFWFIIIRDHLFWHKKFGIKNLAIKCLVIAILGLKNYAIKYCHKNFNNKIFSIEIFGHKNFRTSKFNNKIFGYLNLILTILVIILVIFLSSTFF